MSSFNQEHYEELVKQFAANVGWSREKTAEAFVRIVGQPSPAAWSALTSPRVVRSSSVWNAFIQNFATVPPALLKAAVDQMLDTRSATRVELPRPLVSRSWMPDVAPACGVRVEPAHGVTLVRIMFAFRYGFFDLPNRLLEKMRSRSHCHPNLYYRIERIRDGESLLAKAAELKVSTKHASWASLSQFGKGCSDRLASVLDGVIAVMDDVPKRAVTDAAFKRAEAKIDNLCKECEKLLSGDGLLKTQLLEFQASEIHREVFPSAELLAACHEPDAVSFFRALAVECPPQGFEAATSEFVFAALGYHSASNKAQYLQALAKKAEFISGLKG